MKKNILYILISSSLFFIPGYIWASECSKTCKIEDAPAPALTEYLTNVGIVTDTILDALWEADATDDKNKKSEKKRVLAGMNSILSFGDYFGSFDFKISLPITNEVPQEVKRDHAHIERETEKLSRILKTAEKRGIAGVEVENACQWASNCSLPPATAQELLSQLIKNNQKIAQLYRASILEKPTLILERDFILVSQDFVAQIESYYNKDALTDCSQCEGWFLQKIREKISSISWLNASASEGIQKWKDAWALVRGWKSNPGYAQKQADILSWYLKSQWIESTQAGIIVWNLWRYNQGWLSSNNPLDSSSYNNQAQVDSKSQSFKEALLEKLWENSENKIPIAEITRVNTQIKSTEDIEKTIASLYESQIPFAFTQDVAAQQLQLRIIHMHFSLVNSINILGWQIDSAEKVCDKQDTGNGKCDGYE